MDTAQKSRTHETVAEEAAGWYVALREGLDGAGREAFVGWLRLSPLHVSEYLAISGIDRDLPKAAGRCTASRESLREMARADDEVVPLGARPPRAAVARPRWMTLAVAAAITLAVGLGVWAARGGSGQAFATAHGEQRNWQLPDMSMVTLNSDSAIRVRFDGKVREIVLLRGQAYFSVARDPGRPFRVRGPSASFVALGTAFDVYQQPAGTVVTVTEGRVAVESRQGGVELAAGEQVRVERSGTAGTVTRVDTTRATAWLRQEIALEHQPVSAVVAEFNRYNRMQLEVHDPRVGRIPVSGVFRAHDVRSFIEFLDQLPGVDVITESERTIVTHAPR